MEDTAITTADVETVVNPPSSTDATAAASTTESSAQPEGTTQSSAPDADELTDSSWGAIPQSRRPRILENARTRAREEAQAEWDKQYGWAKTIDRTELEAYRREQAIAGSMSPAQYVENLWRRVESDPQHGPQLRSMAARILGQRQAAEDAEPGPDIPTDASDGVPVVYSATALKAHDAWLQRQILRQVAEQNAPLRQTHEQLEREREQRALQAQSDDFAKRTLDAVSKWPGFKEHAQSIMEKYAALGVTDREGNWNPDPNDPRSEGEKIRDIYAEVVHPALSQTVRQEAIHDLNRKASASTVPANGTGTGQPFDYKNATMAEALRYELSKKGITA